MPAPTYTGRRSGRSPSGIGTLIGGIGDVASAHRRRGVGQLRRPVAAPSIGAAIATRSRRARCPASSVRERLRAGTRRRAGSAAASVEHSPVTATMRCASVTITMRAVPLRRRAACRRRRPRVIGLVLELRASASACASCARARRVGAHRRCSGGRARRASRTATTLGAVELGRPRSRRRARGRSARCSIAPDRCGEIRRPASRRGPRRAGGDRRARAHCMLPSSACTPPSHAAGSRSFQKHASARRAAVARCCARSAAAIRRAARTRARARRLGARRRLDDVADLHAPPSSLRRAARSAIADRAVPVAEPRRA